MTLALFAKIKIQPQTLRTDVRLHSLVHDFLAARRQVLEALESAPPRETV